MDSGAIARVISDGLARNHSPAQIAEAIVALIEDPAWAKAMSHPRSSAFVHEDSESADPLGQGHDDSFRPAHVGHPPDVLVLTDAADQAVAVRSQLVDRRLQVVDFE
jgi:hypothetical protein